MFLYSQNVRLVRALYFFAAFAGAVCAQTDWPAYGHDPGGMRFSPLKQIDTGNVNRLVRAWTYHTGEMPVFSGRRGQRQTAFETTPLIVGGVLYLSTPSDRIIALEPESGRELWKFDLQEKRSKASIPRSSWRCLLARCCAHAAPHSLRNVGWPADRVECTHG